MSISFNILRLSTLLAKTIKRMGMACKVEFIMGRDFLLQLFNSRIAYFDYFSAFQANHMIMVVVWYCNLKSCYVIAELCFNGESGFA